VAGWLKCLLPGVKEEEDEGGDKEEGHHTSVTLLPVQFNTLIAAFQPNHRLKEGTTPATNMRMLLY